MSRYRYRACNASVERSETGRGRNADVRVDVAVLARKQAGQLTYHQRVFPCHRYKRISYVCTYIYILNIYSVPRRYDKRP